MNVDRRTLLIGGGFGVGLIVAFALWPRGIGSDLATREGEQAFGNFIKIARDGQVRVAVPQIETGQGIWTALPQIVADELGAAWESVGVEPAPLMPAYANPLAESEAWLDGLGPLRAHRIKGDGRTRITAGSTSVRAFEQPLREAAAVARSMLVGVAADRWNVSPDECETADGFVICAGQAVAFQELAEEAAHRSPPLRAELRTATKARLFGQSLQRLDGPAKANGSMRFAADVRLPGMLYASARIAPPGGKLRAFDRQSIERAPGVRHVAARGTWIAVAADNWWSAETALKASNPTFSAPVSPAGMREIFADALGAGEVREWFSRGDYDAATKDARALAANYFVAPGQHLGLEPLNATARFSGGALEVWAPTQAPELTRAAAARSADLSTADVTLYPMPVGEPAGRALEADAVGIAIRLARQLKAPVQLTMSQSASQNHDRVSAGAMAQMTALLDQGGLPAARQMRVATADGLGSALSRFTDTDAPDKLGRRALDGAIPPYSILNVRIQAINAQPPFAIGYMRGSPQREMCFFTESFTDELARRGGMEPLAFRMSMLGGNGRLARCLQAAARLARWDGGGAGSTMGIAGCSAFGSHIGLVATLSIADGRVKADRLVAAVDCGRVVNPSTAVQQIEGGLLWALAQATAPPAEWVAGMPRARPMAGIALPRIVDTPDIVVQLIPSSEAPGGTSGLGTTVLAPAVANAIFAGTGRRLRELPFDLARE